MSIGPFEQLHLTLPHIYSSGGSEWHMSQSVSHLDSIGGSKIKTLCVSGFHFFHFLHFCLYYAVKWRVHESDDKWQRSAAGAVCLMARECGRCSRIRRSTDETVLALEIISSVKIC